MWGFIISQPLEFLQENGSSRCVLPVAEETRKLSHMLLDNILPHCLGPCVLRVCFVDLLACTRIVAHKHMLHVKETLQGMPNAAAPITCIPGVTFKYQVLMCVDEG